MSISGLSYGVVRVEEQGSITSLTLQDVGLVMPGGTLLQFDMYIMKGTKRYLANFFLNYSLSLSRLHSLSRISLSHKQHCFLSLSLSHTHTHTHTGFISGGGAFAPPMKVFAPSKELVELTY